ncbi:hypothetical protein U0030_01110 [Brevundimonas bullata]|uniref:hypothetical protein n=1 Tax=Brevundimonas bullata TaxID=13160 RepID=UPI0013B44A65|nr:hypothetical protein [Brevundimonas bullata]WQE37097.1 hypothetical protein U0030_01110 [Brevundimonas bullata]
MADGILGDTLCLEYRIGTSLGEVLVTASGYVSVGFEEVPVVIPALPRGMRVDGVKLLRIGIEQTVTPNKSLLLKVAAARTGYATTGEWLEGMELVNPEGVLQVGLRDCEWLAGEGIVASWASYEANHLQQTVTTAPAGASIFVSVAWRAAGEMAVEDDISTWFAVDLTLPNNSNSI